MRSNILILARFVFLLRNSVAVGAANFFYKLVKMDPQGVMKDVIGDTSPSNPLKYLFKLSLIIDLRLQFVREKYVKIYSGDFFDN